AASIGCGLAETVNQLIIARGAQGVSGALFLPGSLAIISESFDEERRGRAIGTWSAFTAIYACIRPGLRGWLSGPDFLRARYFLSTCLWRLWSWQFLFYACLRAGVTLKAKAWTGWAQGLVHWGWERSSTV